MTLSTLQNQIVASATGFSASIFLDEKPEGQDWTLFLTASAWGNTGLQTSHDGTSWSTEEETLSGTTAAIAVTKNSSRRCPGGVCVRMNVASLSGGEPITLVAK